jgi:competence protein ComEC
MFVLSVLFFVLGVAYTQQQAVLPSPILVYGLGCACSAYLLWYVGQYAYRKTPKPRDLSITVFCQKTLVCVVAGLLGWLYASWVGEQQLANRLSVGLEDITQSVVFRVVEMPVFTSYGIRFVAEPLPKLGQGNQPLPRRIQISWADPNKKSFNSFHHQDLSIKKGSEKANGKTTSSVFSSDGDQNISGQSLSQLPKLMRLRRPHGVANPFGFDAEYWHLSQGIGATASVRTKQAKLVEVGEEPIDELAEQYSNPQSIIRLKSADWHLPTLVERWRTTLRTNIENALQESTGISSVGKSLILGLVIGDQSAIASDDWQIYNQAGVSHLISISGLHITMLAAWCAWLVNFLWRCSPRAMLWQPAGRVALWSGLLIAGVYVLMAGAGVPAVRTWLMLAVVVWLKDTGLSIEPRVLVVIWCCWYAHAVVVFFNGKATLVANVDNSSKATACLDFNDVANGSIFISTSFFCVPFGQCLCHSLGQLFDYTFGHHRQHLVVLFQCIASFAMGGLASWLFYDRHTQPCRLVSILCFSNMVFTAT